MELIVQDLIKAFGWSILNSVWQSGIIYAVVFLILLAAPKMRAAYRHNLSYMALLGMFGWFIATFVSYVSKAGTNAVIPQSFSIYEVSTYIQALPQTFADKAEKFFPLVVTLYALGILVQLFVVVKGYLYLKRIKTTMLSEVPESWVLSFNEVRASLKISRNITFKLSSLVTVPVVAGYLKPVVLFPIALVNHLETDQVEAILIHELSHIRRNDYLLNIIKTCIETVLFFNPFVWLTGKFIQIEREHACDDLVVAHSGRPLSYAQTLLKLELIQQEQVPAYALAATGGTQHLYQRIKRITNMKTNYLKTKQQIAALTLSILGLFSIAWTNPAVKAKAVEVTKSIQQADIFDFAGNEPAQLTEEAVADTVKKKKKMTITFTDDNGNVSIYNSVDAMPDSLKKKMRIFSAPNGGLGMHLEGLSAFSRDSLRLFKAQPFRDSIFRSVRIPNVAKVLEMQEEFYRRNGKTEELAKLRERMKDLHFTKPSKEELERWKKEQEVWMKEWGTKQQSEFRALQRNLEGAVRASEKTAYLKLDYDSIYKKIAKIKLDNNVKIMHSETMGELAKDRAKMVFEKNNLFYNGKRINFDSLRHAGEALGTKFKDINGLTFALPGVPAEVRESAEYKQLTEKYKRDLEELKRKKAGEKSRYTPKPASPPKPAKPASGTKKYTGAPQSAVRVAGVSGFDAAERGLIITSSN